MKFGHLQQKVSLSGDWLENANIGGLFKFQRVVLVALLALLLIRLLVTSHHRADELDGWLLVGGALLLFALTLVRPLVGLLASLFVMPFLNMLYMGGFWGNPASAMLPFAAVYPAWVLRWYWDNFAGGKSLNLFEILVDALLWAGVLRLVTSAASPSLDNGLWMFFTSPTGRFNDEFQWIQVGTFWLCFLATLQIFLSQRKNANGQRLLEGFLHLLFVIILVAVLIDWFFAWPAFQGPYLTSPFLGLHELAAVMLAYLGFFMVGFLRLGGAPGWIHGLCVWICGVVVFATTSRTAWLALVVIFLLLLVFLCRSRKDVVRFVLMIPCLAAGFFLVGLFPPGTLVLPSSHRQDEIRQLSEWGENRTVVYRLQIWQRATALISERPWDGIGFGKFPTTRTEATAGLYDIGHEELKVWDAHNLFLNVGLYQGLPTLVLFLLFLGCWVWMMLAKVDLPAGMAGPPLFAVAGFVMVNMTNSAAAWPLAMQIFACFIYLPFLPGRGAADSAKSDKMPVWLAALCFVPSLLLAAFLPQTILADREMQTHARGYGHFNGIYLFEGNAFQTLAEVGLVFPRESNAGTVRIRINPFLGPMPEAELVVGVVGREGQAGGFSRKIMHGEIVELPVDGLEFLELAVKTPFSILPRRGWFQPAVLVLEIFDHQGNPLDPAEFFYHPALRPATK
jgi:O-antigen ligase